MRILSRFIGGPGLRLGLVVLSAGLAGLAAVPVSAQQAQGHGDTVIRVPSPVLTLDWEALFEATRWGKRIRADLASESRALSDENNRIADDLIAEEKALTERRATMDPKAFRAEANAFDERATGIRNAQKAKAQALSRRFEEDRQAFLEAVTPMLDDILTKRGAVVVLDRRVIIRGLAEADVTDDLARLVDEKVGDGPPPAETPAPGTSAEGAAAPGTAAPETPAAPATQGN